MKLPPFLLIAFVAILAVLPASAFDRSGMIYRVVDAWEGTSEAPGTGLRKFRLGKEISIKIANLDGWLMREAVAKRLGLGDRFTVEQLKEIDEHLTKLDGGVEAGSLKPETQAAIQTITLLVLDRLYPVIGGCELPRASRRGYEPATYSGKDTYHILRFTIDRKSKGTEADGAEAWDRLLKTSRQTIEPTVTLAYRFSPEQPARQIPTLINGSERDGSVKLVIELYQTLTFVVSTVLVVAILGILIWLAPKSEILRDVSQPMRPDGTYPWSLSRAQMAFWFMAVIAGFLFLWVVTGRKDTLTESVLTLIGIGSGTALGAALVSNLARDEEAERRSSEALEKYRSRRGTRWEILKKEALQREAELNEKLQASTVDPSVALPSAQEQTEIGEVAAFFKKGWMREIFFDWLTEGNVVSFHRFQMFAWTLALGLVYVVEVIHNLELPNFDGTLLALTGISSGTYLGFKFPPVQAPPPK